MTKRLLTLLAFLAILTPLFFFNSCISKEERKIAEEKRINDSIRESDSLAKIYVQKEKEYLESSGFLTGVIYMDKKCTGETCETMRYAFNRNSDYAVTLNLYNYYNKNLDEVTQVPLEYVEGLSKNIAKKFPTTSIVSDGEITTLSLFSAIPKEEEKDINLLDIANKILRDLRKANPNWDIQVLKHASPGL